MAAGRPSVFDYRLLRTAMGYIAIGLPVLVSLLATTPLSSISASYHTESRDVFVGLLFVVAAFLFAYDGATRGETWTSDVAALAAVVVALAPTACDGCVTSPTSWLHLVAAVTLFSILAYLCLGPFRQRAMQKGGLKRRRAVVYVACGGIMVVCMLAAVAGNLLLSDATVRAWRLTYWAEAFALAAFGVAWLVAGKTLPGLTDQDERWFRESVRGMAGQTARPE